MISFFKSTRGIQWLCVILMLISIIAISFSFSPQKETKEITNSQATNNSHYTPNYSSSQETPKPTPKTSTYTIKEYEGIIGVFKDEETVPCMTENVKVSTLPEEDKEIMMEGISFDTYKEMISFLQNYE